jgi:WD40 repeat protein
MYVKYIAINPDGRRVLANSCDQAARVWDLATGEISPPQRPSPENEQRLISPDNQYALLQEGSNVWITRVQSNQRLAVLPHTDPVVYASFSRDSRSVITACQENNPVSSKRNDIFLWEVPSGRPINTLRMSQSFLLMYASFSPDNRRVLTCGFDYTARLWDAHTGQPLSDLMRHRERVPWGAFSPDGQSVVTVSWDRTARVWDASNGTPLTAPLQHKAKVSAAFWSSDGKRLTTVTEDEHLQLWDLATSEPLTIPQKIQDPSKSPAAPLSASVQPHENLPSDNRPVSDLVRLAQMLALARIDSGGNVVPLQLSELTGAWQFLRNKYPAQFAVSSPEVTAWHRREADESDAEGNLAAALFHLRHALERQPDDSHLKQQSVEVAARLLEQTNYGLYMASLSQRIPARDPKAGTQQIDLAPYYNLALTDSLDQNGDGDNFASLPSGLQTFAGIRFDVRGIIHLEGLGAKRDGQIYPERVDGIHVGSKCSRLHFLQASAWGAGKDAVVGKYILHYEDGKSRELPIVFGRDLLDWWFPGITTASHERGRPLAAWLGSNRTSANANCPIALFESTRDNPRPNLELVSIDFVSSMSEAAPFLVALSVE